MRGGGLAQIRGNDVGPGHDFGGQPFGQHRTLVEDNNTITQRHDGAHDVLNEQYGRALGAYALDQCDRFVDF